MSFEFFVSEIERCYRVLGRDVGLLQNLGDLQAWLNDGFIDSDMEVQLRSLIWSYARGEV